MGYSLAHCQLGKPARVAVEEDHLVRNVDSPSHPGVRCQVVKRLPFRTLTLAHEGQRLRRSTALVAAAPPSTQRIEFSVSGDLELGMCECRPSPPSVETFAGEIVWSMTHLARVLRVATANAESQRSLFEEGSTASVGWAILGRWELSLVTRNRSGSVRKCRARKSGGGSNTTSRLTPIDETGKAMARREAW